MSEIALLFWGIELGVLLGVVIESLDLRST